MLYGLPDRGSCDIFLYIVLVLVDKIQDKIDFSVRIKSSIVVVTIDDTYFHE